MPSALTAGARADEEPVAEAAVAERAREVVQLVGVLHVLRGDELVDLVHGGLR